MQEIVVMLVCLQGEGCFESTKVYSYYNKDVVEQLNNAKIEVEKVVGPTVIRYGLPLTNAIVNKEFEVKATKNYSIGVSKDKYYIRFEGGF